MQLGCSSSASSLSRSSKIYEIEDLRGPPGVIRQKGLNVLCPLDGRPGAAYVHCLEGKDHVGEATHMLSYSWSYTIGDIVGTLCDFCLSNKLNPRRTYIWICCLCVNQHRVVEQSKLEQSGMLTSSQFNFFFVFGERVKKIGHLLAMMAPWKAPVYIQRIWCIFELYIAHQNGCRLDIVIPPDQNVLLEQELVEGGGVDVLYEALGNTKIQNARASVSRDREAILEIIQSTVGYQVLNNQVNDLLRAWVQSTIMSLVSDRENTDDLQYARFCQKLGCILAKNREYNAALKISRCLAPSL